VFAGCSGSAADFHRRTTVYEPRGFTPQPLIRSTARPLDQYPSPKPLEARQRVVDAVVDVAAVAAAKVVAGVAPARARKLTEKPSQLW